jgi:hypothetical protein
VNSHVGIAAAFAAACLAVTAGCGPGVIYAQRNDRPPIQGQVAELQVELNRVTNLGIFGCSVDVTVRNRGGGIVLFDPDQVFLVSQRTGNRATHTNRYSLPGWWRLKQPVWNSLNVAFKNPLLPGATYSAVLWYDNECPKAGDVEYANNHILHFPG